MVTEKVPEVGFGLVLKNEVFDSAKTGATLFTFDLDKFKFDAMGLIKLMMD